MGKSSMSAKQARPPAAGSGSERASPQPPIACSLGAADYRERIRWIADLNRGSLLTDRQDDLRLELTYAAQAAEQVRQLVQREARCCPFFTFQIDQDADSVRLTVTAPAEARDSAHLLFEQFRARD
jgi:hypothetical protein